MKRPIRLSVGEKLVITANTLLDGRIVWRAADGAWARHIRAAELLDADTVEPAVTQARATAQADGVVGIYEVLVMEGDTPAPVTVRERIRALGPSVHPDFAVPEPKVSDRI